MKKNSHTLLSVLTTFCPLICSSLTKLTLPLPPIFVCFLEFISFLSWECRDIETFVFLGVNVRSLCVAGFEGGGTPGHLLMGGGVFHKKTSFRRVVFA